MKKSQKGCLVACFIVGVLAICVGIVGPLIIHKNLNKGIRDLVVVDSFDSPGYASWQNNTLANSPPLFMQFYVFNVTNAEGVLRGEKAVLKELGPYSYRKYSVGFNVSFHDDGNEREFRKWEYYQFDAGSSFSGASPLTDVVTVINVPLQGVIGALFLQDTGSNSHWWKSLVFDLLASYSNSQLFVRLNVSDLIFGYKDPLLELLSTLQPGTSPYFGLQVNQTSVAEAYLMNSTTVYTGKKDIKKIGVYKDFQGQSSVSCWGSTYANTIRGNDATAFHPGVSINEHLAVYVDNVFRSTNLVASQTIDVHGIQLYAFGLKKEDMKNATENPENAAYFQYGPSGVLNLTSCSAGAPVFVSKPHFLDADPSYRAQFDGLNPDRQLHDTVIAVEPITGNTMSAHKRLQINAKLQSDKLLYPLLQDGLYFPLAWVDETGEITPTLAKEFREKVYLAETIGVVALWGGLGIGVVFILATSILGVAFHLAEKERKDYVQVDTTGTTNNADEEEE